MNKISKALKAVVEIIKNPRLLNNVLNTPEVWDEYVKKRFNLSNGLSVVKIGDLFDNEEEIIYPYSFSDGGSLPTDLILLKKAAKSFDACKYFEIGTWRGESVVNVADIAEKCYTLNLSDSEMRELNFNENYIKQIGCYIKNTKNIICLKGNSLNFNYKKYKNKFDLVFIDGEHHYDYVLSDTKNVFKYLIHSNSIVIWHDYAYTPERVRNQVLAAILDGTPKEIHNKIYHPEGTISAIFINKKIKGNILDKYKQPENIYKIKLKQDN